MYMFEEKKILKKIEEMTDKEYVDLIVANFKYIANEFGYKDYLLVLYDINYLLLKGYTKDFVFKHVSEVVKYMF